MKAPTQRRICAQSRSPFGRRDPLRPAVETLLDEDGEPPDRHVRPLGVELVRAARLRTPQTTWGR